MRFYQRAVLLRNDYQKHYSPLNPRQEAIDAKTRAMNSRPSRKNTLLRPKTGGQARLGVARQPSVFGSATKGSVKRVGYLFVNKDQAAGSLSKSKATATHREINVHVQRFRLQHGAPLDGLGDRRRPPVHKECVFDPDFHEMQLEGATDLVDASSFAPLDSLPHRSDHSGSGSDAVLSLYSNNFVEGDTFDPFGGTAVPIDKSTHNMLQFFLQVGWKAHLRNIGKADQLSWIESFNEVSGIVQSCMTNKMHMYALLALIPMRMYRYGVASAVTKQSARARMFNALRAMRQYFAHLSAAPVDHHVILDIFYISLSEFLCGNFDEMRTHLRMVRFIVDSLGGFKNVSQYIREVCWFTELCFALRTGETPLFELTWDPGPARYNTVLRDKSASWPAEIKACGSGFESPLRRGFFDGPARIIIEELVEDIPALEYVRNATEAVPTESQWACIRSRAILHRVMSLETHQPGASRQERKVHCVLTTLIKLLGYENLCVSPIRYSEAVVRRLIDALQSSSCDFGERGNWGIHNDMLLWIMITGLRLGHGSGDEGWFLSKAVQGCRLLGLESYDDLYGLVRKFIWVENGQCPALVKLAGHVLNARAESLDIERGCAALADCENLGGHMYMLRV